MKKRYIDYLFLVMCIFVLFCTFLSGIGSAGGGFGNNMVVEFVDYQEFFDLFKNHHSWNLEYKRYESSSWQLGNDYLTIEKTWIPDMGSWKFNLIFDNPLNESLYSARFTFAVDLPVLDYIERTDIYIYYLNYSGYSCFFDWSDMVSIPNIVFTHGVYDGMFWFRFQRDNIPALYHGEFDPWFGENTGDQDSEVLDNKILGSPFYLDSGCQYVNATNMSAYIAFWGEGLHFNLTMGIYDNITKTLVGQTEERTVTGSGKRWEQCNFSPNLTLETNKWYLLVVWCNDSSSDINLRLNNTSPYLAYNFSVYASTLPNIYVEEGNNIYNHAMIFCNYTGCWNDSQEPQNETEFDCDYVGLCPSTAFFIVLLFFAYLQYKMPYDYFYICCLNAVWITLILILGVSVLDYVMPSQVVSGVVALGFILYFLFLAVGKTEHWYMREIESRKK